MAEIKYVAKIFPHDKGLDHASDHTLNVEVLSYDGPYKFTEWHHFDNLSTS